MTISMRLIFVTGFVFALGIGPPKPSKQQLSLSIGTMEQTLKIGSEASIQTTLTNISDHKIQFFDRNPDCDYVTYLRDINGNLVRETSYKQRLDCTRRLTDARNISVILKPRESRQEEIPLTRLYDLTQPGKYFVQVVREIPKELGGGIIRSNTLTITMQY